MKHHQYFRFSVYASLISCVLMLQNVHHLLDPRFILMLVTIWVCLLFFANFEQRQDRLRNQITQAIKQKPQLIQSIIIKTGLSSDDLVGLAPTRRFNYTTLKSILTIIQQSRKDSSC